MTEAQESESDYDIIEELNQDLLKPIPGEEGTLVPAEIDSNPTVAIALASNIPTGNQYVDDCNLGCHQNCLAIKDRIPFPVLETCVSNKCHCNHT